MKKLFLSASIIGLTAISFAANSATPQPQTSVQGTQKQTVSENHLQVADNLYKQEKYKEAFVEYEKLSKKGNAQATYNMGVLYEQGAGVAKSDKKAIESYKKSASQGYSLANFALAKAYLIGSHGVKKDDAKGKNYLILAANAGLPVAQLGLAQVLLKEGKPESTKVAVAFLESLSSKNILAAQHLLALVNLNKPNYEQASTPKAIQLLENSAKQGYIPSIATLGEMNHKGLILNKNLKNAEAYYKVLADNKVPNAEKVLKEIQEELKKK